MSRLLKQTDNYKNVFSDMKESSKYVWTNLQNCNINNIANEINLFWNITNSIRILIIGGGGRTCRFCSMIGSITPSCATKMNIGRIIKGDDLIDLLKDKYAFKSIEKSG